jgi:DNA-binding transcriptional MerR regulator
MSYGARVADVLDVSQVAARAGVTVATLRYYEEAGLIDSLPRPVTARRRYDPQVLDTLAVIAALRRAGFPVAQVRDFLAIKVAHESADQRVTRAKEAVEALERHLRERRADLAEAEALLDRWRSQIAGYEDATSFGTAPP